MGDKKRFLLHKNQWTIFRSIARYIVIAAGRRFGKTTVALNKCVEKAVKSKKQTIWYVAPTYRQAKQIAWKLLIDMIPREVMEKKPNESELKIILRNGSSIELKGADNPDSLRGTGVDFVVLDEYATMKHNVWGEIIRPMLIDSSGGAMFIGTPKGMNHFKDLADKADTEKDWEYYHFTSYDNPMIDVAELDEAKTSMHPVAFNQEIMASFVANEDMTLITTEMIEKWKLSNPLVKENREIIACDPSQGGDACEIGYIRNGEILDRLTIYERDTMKIVGHLLHMGRKVKCDNFIIDSIGIGAGVGDRVSEHKGETNVIKFIGSKGDESGIYLNHRTMAYAYTAEKIRNLEIPYCKDLDVQKDLNATQFSIMDSNGKIKLAGKDKIKILRGKSPDAGDMFTMGIWGLQFVEPTKIRDRWRKGQRDEDIYSNYNWKSA